MINTFQLDYPKKPTVTFPPIKSPFFMTKPIANLFIKTFQKRKSSRSIKDYIKKIERV